MAEAGLVMLLDLTAFALILRVYLKNKRKSALAFSLAWFFDFLTILFGSDSHYELSSLFLATFSALIFYGSLTLLKEERESLSQDRIRRYSLVPPIAIFYFWILKSINLVDEWMFMVGISSLISCIFLVISGVLIKTLDHIYEKKARYLSYTLALFGIHLLPLPILGRAEWYFPIGFTISTVLILILTILMIRLTSSKQFNKLKEAVVKEIDIKTGVLIVDQEEYKRLREKLKDAPVLAFLREIKDAPENWECFFVTTAVKEETKNAIYPTDLAKMTELSYRYLKTAADSKVKGIVVIDCLEYLLIYNETSAIMKFLTKLTDFALINNSTLILVADKSALGEKQWALLNKLLGEIY
ncbi:hypothetical protein PAP_07785 [Palaeococcus pacificus DY20341]|uniref:DUF835 domain-containing protein n=1 Tax=Palaeococcus pacificus DY20341 TaxID=1343739 RepID=A0A075LUY8_9EURY|nr:DUF835 domain-containing protein [Palaeococcus pacificus]AIF69946.1 hypothetical protein PAP_07785 [Palaeococcus pacificus DY20341]